MPMTIVREVTPEQAAVNRIRSYLGTLELYRRTSIHSHGRLIDSVYLLAVEFEDKVNTVQGEFQSSPEVARIYNKFMSYLEVYKLI